MDIGKIFLNIKNVMLALLAVVAAYAFATTGLQNLTHLVTAMVTAVVLDSAIFYLVKKQPLRFPDSALITGFIIGLVMSSFNPLYSALTAVLAILSKHLLRFNGRHVFNPGNFAILVATFLYPAQAFQTWWASANVVVTGAVGLVNVWRLSRWTMMAAFLIPYLAVSLLLQPQPIQNLVGGTLLFFAFFMFIEPFTSPLFSEKARMFFGILVAFFALLIDFGAAYGLPEITKYGFPAALVLADLFVPLLNKKFPALSGPRPSPLPVLAPKTISNPAATAVKSLSSKTSKK